ncbi:HAMP domain-containing sensor histidine kinase [Nocardia seriolae]|uniref:HAMP domain-containing sensor histidine kinase n=1 Tax=Nocardia seriolae TaxID=37332 RepID=UPI0008FF12AC|nr:HAMP domain-containing sensor histidine kinase [Nocardia seriolae]WKY49735.1 HAMP domain-containing sensor histidine kinase [Nocardia seriolae]WNJ62036.1 HAMP domain-containing sensor histidine kinase [Nocardia seriolae]
MRGWSGVRGWPGLRGRSGVRGRLGVAGRLGLRGRIAVFFVLAMALALAGMAAAAYVVVGHELNGTLDLNLRRQATRIARQFPTEPSVAAISGQCRYLAAPSCVQVVAADGSIRSEIHPDQPLPVDAGTRAVAAGSADGFFTDFTLDGLPMRMCTTQLEPGSAVQVAQRSDPVDTGQRRVGLALLAAAAAGLVLAAIIGTVLARRALAPVATLTEAAERVARTGDPKQHIRVTGSDELARLAVSVNTMLVELDAALTAERESRAAQQRLVADASHELRTPLTALRTNIDLLRRADRMSPADLGATAAALRVQSEELSGLVTDLIDLARADDPDAVRETLEDLRLDLLVEDCLDTARRHWPAIEFAATMDPVTIQGAPARLSRAITNLLDNAAKFSSPGGTVEITVAGRAVSIRDAGPGIPAADLPHIFERFYRSAAARATSGHGLGLAIVSQVAALHGIVPEVESDSSGTCFTLTFPTAQ